MQIGYKPRKTRLITGASVLSKIKYTKLRVIGAGANGIVLTDGKYAIKVGTLYGGDEEKMNTAASYGFSVPVVYFEEGIKIDDRIADAIIAHGVKNRGNDVNIEQYLSDDRIADMQITLLVKPYFSHDCDVTQEERNAGYAVAENVKNEYARVSNNRWLDVHPWNLGIYKGGVIIIDF